MEKVMVGWADAGSVHGAFTLSMLQLHEWETQNGDGTYELISPMRAVGAYVQESRNALIRHALEQDADWIMQFDADHSFSPQLLRQLMVTARDNDAKVVTGLYSNVQLFPQETSDGKVTIVNCIYMEAEDGLYTAVAPPKTMMPFKIHAAGAGCLLIHRSVFEAIEDPYFWVEWVEDSEGKQQMMGEDFAFCRRAREAGFDIWCNPLAEIMHWKTLPVLPSTMRDYLEEADKVFSEMSAAAPTG